MLSPRAGVATTQTARTAIRARTGMPRRLLTGASSPTLRLVLRLLYVLRRLSLSVRLRGQAVRRRRLGRRLPGAPGLLRRVRVESPERVRRGAPQRADHSPVVDVVDRAGAVVELELLERGERVVAFVDQEQ